MSRRGQPQETKDRIIRLVRDECVDLAAAARACEISTRTASRILAEVDTPRRSLPFSGEIQPPANVPPPNWGSDQPRPSHRAAFDANYHGHTFRSFSAPLSFEGFTLSRLRAAISLHRQGLFLESGNLALVCLGFAPVLAATIQRLYPAISLPRQLKHGSRGISRIIGEELESQLVPRSGLCPSEFLPPTLFGATQFDLAFMGFSVWQHAFGDPDPETGIRPLYTRRWPTWAVQYYRYRRTFVAMTMDGPVDIVNDGKFTLIADHDEPHFLGAVLSVGEDAFSGISTRRARDTWIERYGDPKIIGTMPEGVAPNSPEGTAAMDSLATIRNPGGYGIIPHGATAQFIGLQATQGTIITDATANAVQNIAAVILGSDGTMTRGAGVYTSPIFEKVSHNIVNRDLTCIKRGINQGHIGTYLAYNYAGTIATASGWIEPVIDIPLPDPDADARIKSYAERVQKFHEIVAKERTNGFMVTQDRADQLAASLEIETPQLLDPTGKSPNLPDALVAPAMKVSEIRASRGQEPFGDERDDLSLAELDAKAKQQPQSEPGAPEGTQEEIPGEAPIGSLAATDTSVNAGPANEKAKSGGAVVGVEAKDIGSGLVINALSGSNITVLRSEKDFDEGKHPREPDGKFGSGSGEGSGGGDSGNDEKEKGTDSEETKNKIDKLPDYKANDLESDFVSDDDYEELKEQSERVRENLSREEERAVYAWGEDFETCHEMRLSQINGFSGEQADGAKTISAMVERESEVSNPVTLYRGMRVSAEVANKLLSDDNLSLLATSSFSSDASLATSYATEEGAEPSKGEDRIPVVIVGRLKGTALHRELLRQSGQESLLSAQPLRITERSVFSHSEHGNILVLEVAHA